MPRKTIHLDTALSTLSERLDVNDEIAQEAVKAVTAAVSLGRTIAEVRQKQWEAAANRCTNGEGLEESYIELYEAEPDECRRMAAICQQLAEGRQEIDVE